MTSLRDLVKFQTHRILEKQTAALGFSLINSQRSLTQRARYLWDREFRLYSQYGEDGILWWLCEQLEIVRPRVLEIGAGNFTECNSRFLAEFRNAFVYAVDARQDLLTEVRRSSLSWRGTVIPHVGYVRPSESQAIWDAAVECLGLPDILSIDIDGVDYWVLRALDLAGIRIVVVEYNSVFGCREAVSVPYQEEYSRFDAHFSGVFYGASLPAFCDLLLPSGFTFVGTNRMNNNAFFVRSDLAEALPLTFHDASDDSLFCDSPGREARDESGNLSHLSITKARQLIAGLDVFDCRTGIVREFRT